MNGNSYRVTVTGSPCGSVNSPLYGLVVYPLPTVIINTNARGLTPATNTTIFATPAPAASYIYQWYLNNAVVNGINSPVLPVYIDGTGSYKVAVTNTNGCTAFSNIITIADSMSSDLFIYPNPTSGRFQVRYYFSNGSSVQGRTILVYDAKGARVYSKQFSVTAGYSRMDVDLVNVESGIYLVELRDGRGKRLGKTQLLIR